MSSVVPQTFLKISSSVLCRSMPYMFGTTWGWINVVLFLGKYTFNPLNPSLLSLSRAKKHLHATSAIGSCPLPFISIHRASQSHRHRATFFSFRMCVRPCVERDLLCTFPLKKREDGDEWMRGKIWGLADSLVGSISRRQTSLPLRACEPLGYLTGTKNLLPFWLMRSFYSPETKMKCMISWC